MDRERADAPAEVAIQPLPTLPPQLAGTFERRRRQRGKGIRRIDEGFREVARGVDSGRRRHGPEPHGAATDAPDMGDKVARR
jgi:hypothetical protein